MEILGIDVGGTGIKGAPVDTQTGQLLAPRLRIPTPEGARPEEVAKVIAQVAQSFDWHGAIGCGFPAAVRDGIVLTAANISKRWIGVNAAKVFSETTACPVCVVNDADAAGMAEITFGAGRKQFGVIIVVTIGTGLGTALFTNHTLLPNAELGHIEIDGQDAELSASDAARKRDELSWKKWGKRFNIYISRLEKLFWPNLFILGGGVSKDFEKFREFLTLETPVVTAQFLNEAGIVGAALSAASCPDRLSADPGKPD